MELDINQYHSVKDCLRNAYTAMRHNMKPILRQTWWLVLIEAVAMAVACYFFLPNKALHDWGVSNPYSSFAMQSVVYLVAIAANVAMTAAFWRLINGRKWGTNLLRTFVVAILSLAIGIAAWAAFQSLGNWLAPATTLSEEMPSRESVMTTWIFLSIGTTMALAIILTPLTYSFTRYMMGDKRMPWGGYVRGLKHWGTLFLVQLLAAIIMGVILAVISLPLDVLITAQLFSQLGALEGDPLDIPAYFTPLLLATLAIFFYVAAYAALWAQIVFAYQYGSIETQQREKKLQKA